MPTKDKDSRRKSPKRTGQTSAKERKSDKKNKNKTTKNP